MRGRIFLRRSLECLFGLPALSGLGLVFAGVPRRLKARLIPRK
jgi:hypothetical protein